MTPDYRRELFLHGRQATVGSQQTAEYDSLLEQEFPGSPGLHRLPDGRPLWRAGINDAGLRWLVWLWGSRSSPPALRKALEAFFLQEPIAHRLEGMQKLKS